MWISVIDEVLHSREEFIKLGCAVHVPLRMIIRDVEGLGEREIGYLMSPQTHVDFAVFSKISKKYILIIEVDGYHFHKDGTKQAKRDEMKNTILKNYQIPYIRFRTNESGEKEILFKKLWNCMCEQTN